MEIWKTIDGFNGMYQVSNLGKVKSNYGKGKILTQTYNKYRGYNSVILYSEIKNKRVPTHVLVATAFLKHKPNGKLDLIVDHINNDKLDNRVENLQIITQRENASKDKCPYCIGTTFHKSSGKWQASIRHNGRRIYLGKFKDRYEAAKAYQNKLNEISS